MARRIIFKENGFNLSSDSPNGYRYLGYDGTSISEKYGATISAIGGGLSAVQYANVLFVDNTNPSINPLQNEFNSPYGDVDSAEEAAALLSPTSTDRTLIYVRRGTYSSVSIILRNYTDWYCEPGVVFVDSVVHDNTQIVEARFMGKAKFTGYGSALGGLIFRANSTGSNIYFEFDEISTTGGAIEVTNGSSVTFEGRRIYSETLAKAFGATFRGSGTIILNLKEDFLAWHSVIFFRGFSGQCYVKARRLYLDSGNYYGGNYKQILYCSDNLGGYAEIDADLVANSIAGYYGGVSGVISRWTDSWMTLKVNGDIKAENQFGVYGLGSSGASRTIINGDVDSNNLIAYVASNSTCVFRNGTLINRNTYTGSEGYPILSVGSNGVYYVENCHMYSFGTASTVSAFWKDTTTSQINTYNTIYSAVDTNGFFIRNSTSGTPSNDVRIHNCRSTKPLDTNINDLLSPTGFILDTNILALNFI